MVVGEHRAGVEEGEQLRSLVDEVVLHDRLAAPPQRPGSDTVRAGCSPETEIDAAWEHRLQGAEELGHAEGAVVGQHDAARPDPHRRCLSGDARDQQLRRGAGERRHVVVLGEPLPPIAESLDVTGQLDRPA